MRIDVEEFDVEMVKMFVVRDTPTWRVGCSYLSWAARDFGMPWSNLDGAILFPNGESASKATDECGGYLAVAWVPDDRRI